MKSRELAIARVVHGLAQVVLCASGCAKDEAPAPPPPAPVAKPAPAPARDAAVAPDAAPARITHVRRYDNATLCFDPGDCIALVENTPAGHRTTVARTRDDLAIRFDDACEWTPDRITCESPKGTPADHVRMVPGREEGYLVFDDGSLQYFLPAKAAARKPMRAFPGGVKQLSVGFRAGCVLAGDGTAWCWSDPAAPKQVTVPAHVADIAVIDPFELCVRTDDGAVYCTPPFKQSDRFACSTSTRQCGDDTGTPEQAGIVHPFDPLVPLTRPLARIPLPEPATVLAPEQSQFYVIVMDVLKTGGTEYGACAAGARSVTCWRACDSKWHAFDVAGLPANAALSPDEEAGHALAPDGTVWRWSPTCDAASVTATKLDLPPIAELATTLFVRAGPQLWLPTRCALTRDGRVTCWAFERYPTPPKLDVFDPMSFLQQQSH